MNNQSLVIKCDALRSHLHEAATIIDIIQEQILYGEVPAGCLFINRIGLYEQADGNNCCIYNIIPTDTYPVKGCTFDSVGSAQYHEWSIFGQHSSNPTQNIIDCINDQFLSVDKLVKAYPVLKSQSLPHLQPQGGEDEHFKGNLSS